jgi:DNA-binding MarR family transcriptional regulator
MAIRQAGSGTARRREGSPASSEPANHRRIPAIGLGRLLREADLAFNRALRKELARHNVTFSEYQHLWQLWKEDDLAQFVLSQRIGIEDSSSTAAIGQLERKGYIRRYRDPKDRRRIIAALTPAGKKLEGPLNDCAIIVNRRARLNISVREIFDLFDIVGKIIANFRDQ